MENNPGFPKVIFRNRLSAIQKAMAEIGVEALIAISGDHESRGHVAYLTNLWGSFLDRRSQSNCGHVAAVLTAEGNLSLILPGDDNPKEFPDVKTVFGGHDLAAGVIAAIKQEKLGKLKIGIAGMDILPTHAYLKLIEEMPNADFIPADTLLETQRMIKTPEEIEILRENARVVDAALQAGLACVLPSAMQIDIENAIRKEALIVGADYIEKARVLSGSRISTRVRSTTGRKVLQEGDFISLELTGWRCNYSFAGSRVSVVGNPSPEQEDCLNHFADAIDWMVEVMLPERVFRFNLTESRGRIIHPFGHGIGLDIYEKPWIVMNQEFVLKPNMVLCLEPSIISKIAGELTIGVMVLITEKGPVALTKIARPTGG